MISANLPFSPTQSRATIRAVPKFFYCVSGHCAFCTVYTEFFFIFAILVTQTIDLPGGISWDI